MARLSGNACPLSPNIRFSRTVSHGNTEPCCEIRMPRESGRVRSAPSMVIEPASGRMKPAIMFIRVDFPQPDGPTMATNSPSPTVRLTASTTGRMPLSVAKLLLRSETSILVGIAPPGPLRALQDPHRRIQRKPDEADDDHARDDEVVTISRVARVHDHVAETRTQSD